MVEWIFISDASGEILVDSGSTCQNARIVQEKDDAILNLKRLAKRKQSGSIGLGFYSRRYVFRDNILYLTICSKYYPRKLSTHFLEEVISDFEKIRKNAKAICLQNFGSAIQKKQRLYTSLQVQVNYWSLIIHCSDARQLVEISDDELYLDEKYKKEAVSLLLEQNETSSQKSVVIGSYRAHCMVEGGIAYITMCGKSYPAQLAGEFLKMLKSEFDRQFGTQVRHAKIHGSFSSFGTCMKRTVSMYWDTRAERAADLDADEANGKCIELENLNEAGVRTMQKDLYEVEGLDKDAHDRDVDEMSSPLKMADGVFRLLSSLKKRIPKINISEWMLKMEQALNLIWKHTKIFSPTSVKHLGGSGVYTAKEKAASLVMTWG